MFYCVGPGIQTCLDAFHVWHIFLSWFIAPLLTCTVWYAHMHDFMQNSLTDGDKLTKCELGLSLEGGSTNGYDSSKFIQWCCKTLYANKNWGRI